MKSKANSIKTTACILFIYSAGSLFGQNRSGVLILAHGGSPVWEATVHNAAAPLKQQQPTEVAFGMADPMTMQEGINNLERQGASTIVIVPLFISSHSVILRQTEYLVGLRKELADEPLLMNHSGSATAGTTGGHSHESSSGGYAGETHLQTSLDPLIIHSKIILTKALDADTLVASVLFERIQEFSKDPTKETLLLIAHGPNEEEDNKEWIRELDDLAAQIKIKQLQGKKEVFKNIFTCTVRDDANKKVYNEAKEKLRNIVQEANKESTTIVVPVVLAMGGIEKGIQKRLEGLEYTWVNKALLPHENITRFIQNSVAKSLLISE